MSTVSICQGGVHNAREFDNALFLNERLSDLTITFPSHNISFPAHRLMMARKSAYFENLFYGPMAMNGKEWKVKDNDIEPEVLKIVLAHCYDLNLLDKDVEMTLQIYKLADFYVIESLKSQCRRHVLDIIEEDSEDLKCDYQYILNWSKEFGFNDIKNEVFEFLSTKLFGSSGLYGNSLYVDIIDHSFLLNLTLETCSELFGTSKFENELFFKESWRNPKNPLSSELMMSIVEFASRNGISILQGCFSPQVVRKIVTTKEGMMIFLSVIDTLHLQALYKCVKDLNIYTPLVNLHIPCNSIPPNNLSILPSSIYRLYLSNVDDQSSHWAASLIISLNPYNVYFPRSSLSIIGFKALIAILRQTEVYLDKIEICSSNMRHENENELMDWLHDIDNVCKLKFLDLDDEINGW